jgi:hypothetical protein
LVFFSLDSRDRREYEWKRKLGIEEERRGGSVSGRGILTLTRCSQSRIPHSDAVVGAI